MAWILEILKRFNLLLNLFIDSLHFYFCRETLSVSFRFIVVLHFGYSASNLGFVSTTLIVFNYRAWRSGPASITLALMSIPEGIKLISYVILILLISETIQLILLLVVSSHVLLDRRISTFDFL
jgi:hypothetical protein